MQCVIQKQCYGTKVTKATKVTISDRSEYHYSLNCYVHVMR